MEITHSYKKGLHVKFMVVFLAVVKNGRQPGFTSVSDWINYHIYQWVEYYWALKEVYESYNKTMEEPQIHFPK